MLAAGVVLLAAILARLPALGSWWCLDDWGQLARAAGLVPPEGGVPARWLSQHLWWSLTWPLFGLHAKAHAAARILLHALAALTVFRIARRAHVSPTGSVLAGLCFAATPIASTVLFWASGIQELLGGLFALLAVERWLAGGRRNVLLAGLFGCLSLLAKESALGLPLLLAALLVWRGRARREDRRLRWAVCAFLMLAALLEGALVLRHFATGVQDRYSLAGGLIVLGNVGKFGWWLITLGPVFTGQVTWTLAAVGIALFAVWAAWGAVAFRRGRLLPGFALLAALLSLAPALPLVHQARPYLAYLAAAAGCLTLGELVRPKRPLTVPVALIGALVAVTLSNIGMRAWIETKSADGLPADPIVRASRISRETAAFVRSHLPAAGLGRGTTLVVFQQPLRKDASERVNKPADSAVTRTPRYAALEGAFGLSVLAGTGVPERWTASLLDVPSASFVFCESGAGLEAWGGTWDALIYAAAVDWLGGNFETARAELLAAASLREAFDRFCYDASVLDVPAAVLVRRAIAFQEWLESPPGASGATARDNARALVALRALMVRISDR